MQLANRIESQKALDQLEQLKLSSQELLREREDQFAQQVSQEIERKQLLLKEEKLKRKKDSSRVTPIIPTHFSPTLANAIVCPVALSSQPIIQSAWFAESLEVLYSVETYEIQVMEQEGLDGLLSQLDVQLQALKRYRHTNAPVVHDYEIIHVSGLATVRILTSTYRNIKLLSLLGISKVLPVSTAASILSSLLSVYTDRNRLTMPVSHLDSGMLWFDPHMHIVLETIYYLPALSDLIGQSAHRRRWQPPIEISQDYYLCEIWNLGALLMEILTPDIGKYKTPHECLAEVFFRSTHTAWFPQNTA
jgi:hypothetical protein